MKKLIFLVLLIHIVCIANAQNTKVVRKVVTILPEQVFYLNGGMHADLLNGKSRVYYKIDLPQNTLGWCYALTTTENKNTTSLHLAEQLSKTVDPTGVTAIAIDAAFAPTGVSLVDVYLMDQQNIELFMRKVDNNGGKFSYKISGTRMNFNSGVVPIKIERSGTWYIGIKNPSPSVGINVHLEVVAIVEERETVALTDEQQKAQLYGTMGANAFKKGDYGQCIELSKKALEYDATAAWIKLNISLSYLVLQKQEYLDSYIDALTTCKKSGHAREYFLAELKEIEEVQAKTGHILHADEITELIKQELKSN
ncbi:MAG: hypothetical protein P4L41_02130 [Flavipsychrobacter sp.]|nr:hypothetical protein [Flavipsychrobacter sp.]